jgi:hypothetical protein
MTLLREITENASLLEVIYRINEFSPEADNTISCLIRSMLKTSQTAYEYVSNLASMLELSVNGDKIRVANSAS